MSPSEIGTQLHNLLAGHFHGFRRRSMDDGYNTFLAHCNVNDAMALSRPEWEMSGQPTFKQYVADAERRREVLLFEPIPYDGRYDTTADAARDEIYDFAGPK